MNCRSADNGLVTIIVTAIATVTVFTFTSGFDAWRDIGIAESQSKIVSATKIPHYWDTQAKCFLPVKMGADGKWEYPDNRTTLELNYTSKPQEETNGK